MKIEMKSIHKAFTGTMALKNAQFSMEDGEIHALMGENGAGKSTLMKILTGVYKKDKGEVYVDGQLVDYKHPSEAAEHGIVFIYQELNVLPTLTVEQNLFLGREIKNKLGIIDKKEMRKKCIEVLDKLGVTISPNSIISDLSIGSQQMVEIAKALMTDAKVIIMDEPTAALTPRETEVLFKVIRQLKSRGVSMVYISHRMEEIFELCDRITILRDGEYVGTRIIAETDINEIVKMMIGREIGERYPIRENTIGDVVFSVNGLTKKSVFENITFDVRAGEVLGISGLMGAGRTEIMHAIFGNLAFESGTMNLASEEVKIKNPMHAKKLGIGFITEDRKSEGLLLEESIKTNIALTNFDIISNAATVLNFKREKELADRGINELSIRCSGYNQLCGGLSGGNQQKVVFAKWLFINPKLLILDEPTRGVDIGAKKEIYTIINKLTSRGVAIIMVSSELPEVLGVSDRIMVIHEGHIKGILNKDEADQEKVMTLATGGSL